MPVTSESLAKGLLIIGQGLGKAAEGAEYYHKAQLLEEETRAKAEQLELSKKTFELANFDNGIKRLDFVGKQYSMFKEAGGGSVDEWLKTPEQTQIIDGLSGQLGQSPEMVKTMIKNDTMRLQLAKDNYTKSVDSLANFIAKKDPAIAQSIRALVPQINNAKDTDEIYKTFSEARGVANQAIELYKYETPRAQAAPEVTPSESGTLGKLIDDKLGITKIQSEYGQIDPAVKQIKEFLQPQVEAISIKRGRSIGPAQAIDEALRLAAPIVDKQFEALKSENPKAINDLLKSRGIKTPTPIDKWIIVNQINLTRPAQK